MGKKIVRKISVGMYNTNIHLLQIEILSHLEKHGLLMPVHQNSFQRKNM